MLLAFVFIVIVALLWLLFSAPVGTLTVTRRRTMAAAPGRILSALDPAGDHSDWNGAIVRTRLLADGRVHIQSGQAGRDGQPIERVAHRVVSPDGMHLAVTYGEDTALSDAFWQDYRFEAVLRPGRDGTVDVTLRETDRYNGLGFAVFRYFALGRIVSKLKVWAETGRFKPGGLFEHPVTQFFMAGLSVLLMWPLFGLHTNGLLLSVALTLTVAMHELGHMLAFRLMGHKRARVIFIPLLGGIAVGGRPYDKHFEVAFAALMGAGFSAFPVGLLFLATPSLIEPRPWLLVCVMMIGLFNLANLLPVNRFDGGQVLRQVWQRQWPRAIAAAAIIALFIGCTVLGGISLRHAVAAGGVVLLLSLLTGSKTVRPRHPLTPMTTPERAAIMAGLASVLIIHGGTTAWAVQLYFA